jgi:hypothetical protein
MNQVRHGICIGGPKAGQTLATMQPGAVHHPGDAGGFYVFKNALGPDVAKWLWIKKEKSNADK